MQLCSTVFCFGLFNSETGGGGQPVPKLFPDMVVFICVKPCLCPSVNCGRSRSKTKWNVHCRSSPCLTVRVLHFPISSVPLFPRCPSFPCVGRPELWRAACLFGLHISVFPPPSLAASLLFHANLTYKFCPSVTNESIVELWPNSFLCVSPLASCDSVSLPVSSSSYSLHISLSFSSASLTQILCRKDKDLPWHLFFFFPESKQRVWFCSGPSCCVCVTHLEKCRTGTERPSSLLLQLSTSGQREWVREVILWE